MPVLFTTTKRKTLQEFQVKNMSKMKLATNTEIEKAVGFQET